MKSKRFSKLLWNPLLFFKKIKIKTKSDHSHKLMKNSHTKMHISYNPAVEKFSIENLLGSSTKKCERSISESGFSDASEEFDFYRPKNSNNSKSNDISRRSSSSSSLPEEDQNLEAFRSRNIQNLDHIPSAYFQTLPPMPQDQHSKLVNFNVHHPNNLNLLTASQIQTIQTLQSQNQNHTQNQSFSETLTQAQNYSKKCELETKGHKNLNYKLPRDQKTGKLIYQCCYCKKVLSQLSNLKVHLRVHTGEKPFKCHLCPQQFNQMAHLQKHFVVHHSLHFKC